MDRAQKGVAVSEERLNKRLLSLHGPWAEGKERKKRLGVGRY